MNSLKITIVQIRLKDICSVIKIPASGVSFVYFEKVTLYGMSLHRMFYNETNINRRKSRKSFNNGENTH